MIKSPHEESENILEETEKEIYKEYQKTTQKGYKRLLKYLLAFLLLDKKLKKAFEGGEITKDEYKSKRWFLFYSGGKWVKERKKLVDLFVETKQKSVEITHKSLTDVFTTVKNNIDYQIEKETEKPYIKEIETPESAEKKLTEPQKAAEETVEGKPIKTGKQAEKAAEKPIIPKENPVDVVKEEKSLKQQFDEIIMQGIDRGKSVQQIAKDVEAVAQSGYKSALRYARTMTTSAENYATYQSMLQASENGIVVTKMWIATLDMRTRHTHAILDREKQALTDRFSNGLLFPGDKNGNPSEWWNCRCSMGWIIESVDYSNAPRFSRLGNMTEAEWKEYHRQELEKKKARAAKRENRSKN